MRDAYDLAVRTAQRMIRAGARFDQVEEYVDQLELAHKEKTVVWLIAWARLPRDDRLMIIELSQAKIKLRSYSSRRVDARSVLRSSTSSDDGTAASEHAPPPDASEPSLPLPRCASCVASAVTGRSRSSFRRGGGVLGRSGLHVAARATEQQ